MRFLFSNGVVSYSSEVPPVITFLESLPGAYTTTRTHENGTTLLFWERHLKRLSNSTRILLNSKPELIFKAAGKNHPLFISPLSITSLLKWESRIRSLVSNSLNQVLPIALKEKRSQGEELAVTALVCGDMEKLKSVRNVSDGDDGVFKVLDVHLHIGNYVPPLFGMEENGARLALVGRGRDVAAAKYSAWVRLRKPLDKLKPPSVTELLLSNDGDRILEGCITNFFVVSQRDKSEAEGKYLHDYDNSYSVEVQTAPVSDGVLPGVIRQLVIEVCISKGIPVREVAPSWEKHGFWKEAFVTNSLRILQHVETIKVPRPWKSLESKCSEGISWIEKKFQGPGIITKVIQKGIMERASMERHPLNESI